MPRRRRQHRTAAQQEEERRFASSTMRHDIIMQHPTAVALTNMQGDEAWWGCWCSHNGCQTLGEMPPSMHDLYSADEWQSLQRDVDATFDKTECAFCCPWSPCFYLLLPLICWCMVKSSLMEQRRKRLQERLERENAIIAPRGLRWLLWRTEFLFVLEWTAARPAWEAVHPERRAVTREPLPVEFTPQIDTFTLHLDHLMGDRVRQGLPPLTDEEKHVLRLQAAAHAAQQRSAAAGGDASLLPLHAPLTAPSAVYVGGAAPARQQMGMQPLVHAEGQIEGAVSPPASAPPLHLVDTTSIAPSTIPADAFAPGLTRHTVSSTDIHTASDSSSDASVNFCPCCGTRRIVAEQRFCSHCGKAV